MTYTWTKKKTCIIQIAKEILGESGGSFVVKMDITWWNEEFKASQLSRKKECYLALENA